MKLRTEKKEFWIVKKTDEGVARFLVVPMTAKESFDLLQEATPTIVSRNQQNPGPDFYILKIKKINRIIKNWEGVEDEEGNAIPCTPKMKELVYNLNRDLIDEILDEADRLADIRQQQKEEDQKNLEAGLVG